LRNIIDTKKRIIIIGKNGRNKMSVCNFKEAKKHLGHQLICIGYGKPIQNISFECLDCKEVIIDFEKEETK
jgi:hypothetical protein